jgi:hypothetical protein
MATKKSEFGVIYPTCEIPYPNREKVGLDT